MWIKLYVFDMCQFEHRQGWIYLEGYILSVYMSESSEVYNYRLLLTRRVTYTHIESLSLSHAHGVTYTYIHTHSHVHNWRSHSILTEVVLKVTLSLKSTVLTRPASRYLFPCMNGTFLLLRMCSHSHRD